MRVFDGVLIDFEELEDHQKIWFLQEVFKRYPHKYEYAMMSEPLQRFYNPSAKRGE